MTIATPSEHGHLAATVRPRSARVPQDRSDRRLTERARGQHGVLTAAQLEALGLSPRAIRHRAASGRLCRIHTGVYAVGRLDAHGRWMAAVLACGPGAVLSHRSAAALWDFGTAGQGEVDVTVAGRAGRSRRGIAVHRGEALAAEDVAIHEGVPCTSVARTLLDLASIVDRQRMERAVDRAEALRRFDLHALRKALHRHRHRRGASTLAAILADYTAPTVTRSGYERLLLSLVADAALPPPRTNAWIALDGNSGYEADFLWPDRHLIVEVDGRAHHARRRAFAHDRQRDRRLALAGFETRRYAASELTSAPERVVAELSAFLARP
jgi:predicted transcriptional regulator of viral defense system